MTTEETGPPDVTLLVGTGCSHCQAVLNAFGRLLKEGHVGRLDVINASVHPEEARRRGARSVPWMEIGTYHLEGAHSYGELAAWIDASRDDSQGAAYLGHLLETGRLDTAVQRARERVEERRHLLALMASDDTPMTVKIGVGAAMEELAEAGLLEEIVDEIVALTRSGNAQVRADACHFLALSRSPAAVPRLEEMAAGDESPEVREIAAESLEAIREETPRH